MRPQLIYDTGMGAPAAYFSLYPTPAEVPTNAAVLGSQYLQWAVTVADGTQPIEVTVEWFGGALAIRPVHAWPANRKLAVTARLGDMVREHAFHTGSGAHTEPPRCEWPGPSAIHPKSGVPEPTSWPTNIPRPPRNQRSFSIPPVVSTAGYQVLAELYVSDRGRRWSVAVGLPSAASTVIEPGTPSPFVMLTPNTDQELSDAAQVIGMTVTDVAGNSARYGETA